MYSSPFVVYCVICELVSCSVKKWFLCVIVVTSAGAPLSCTLFYKIKFVLGCVKKQLRKNFMDADPVSRARLSIEPDFVNLS